MRELLLGLLVFAIWIASAVAAIGAAQAERGPFDALPNLFRLYQQRQENITRGLTPPVFSGSASVIPDRTARFVVSLGVAGVPQERGHFCGGAVVDPHWVLTAAHCVVAIKAASGDNQNNNTANHQNDFALGAAQLLPLAPDRIQVLSDTNVLYRDGRVRKPERIVLQPGFRLTPRGVPENDLALLHFKDAFSVPPIALVTPGEAGITLRAGEKVGIAGWGTSSFDASSPISTNLLFAFVDVVDRAKCNAAYEGAVSERMFCAGVGLADACQGDSGGPAWGYNARGTTVLAGVTSWGAGCTEKKYPGVYVDVAKFRGWIDDTIGKPSTSQ